MKTEAWKPAPAEAGAKKESLYVDDTVVLTELANNEAHQLPVMAAIIMAVDFLIDERAFEIRDMDYTSWFKYDGKAIAGPESLQQSVLDASVILDAIVRKYHSRRLKELTRMAQEQRQQAGEQAQVQPSAGMPEGDATQPTDGRQPTEAAPQAADAIPEAPAAETGPVNA